MNTDAQKFYELGLRATELFLYDTAIKFLTSAANRGHADAMYTLAVVYERDGYNPELHKDSERFNFGDEQKIFEWYKRAADHGCKRAFIEVALRYLDEDNLEFNKRAAAKWFKLAISWNQPAAEKGDPFAMMSLASAHAAFNFNKTIRYGGLPDKNSAADKWYQLAFAVFKRLANDGDVEAMFQLSRMLSCGVGTKKNFGESVRYLETAAQVGDEKVKARAFYELGKTFEPVDAKKSVHFYTSAANLGDFTSMRILWRFEKNFSEAERWLRRSEEIQAAFLATLTDLEDAR